MTRHSLNLIAGRVPVCFSVAAFAIVLIAVTTGWERNLRDEGTGAHLFWLLIAGEVPFVLLFLATIDPAHLRGRLGSSCCRRPDLA